MMWRSMYSLRMLLLGLLLAIAQQAVHAADIYGYVDDKGVAHFASEKIDERYQLFFRGGQSFDTAEGVSPMGRGLGAGTGKLPPASQTLLALFEKSPHYKTAKTALQDASKRHAIEYELLQALVATESGFDAQAVKRRTLESKLYDPRINIAAGSRYLRDLIAMFPGEIELALAAYNAGEGAVQRAGNKIPNYRETQNYVKTVLQLYAYLKPSARAAAGRGGGKLPGRIRMELSVPQGGALGRGNLPPPEGAQRVPSLPTD